MNLAFVFLFLAVTKGSIGEFPLETDTIAIQPRDGELSYRLPNNTFPISYDITLEPFFYPDFYFLGEVTIIIEVLEATDIITLHANELNITSYSLKEKDLEEIGIIEDDWDSDYHFLHLRLDEIVQAGVILELYIQYIGELNNDNEGFYRASYVEYGVTKWFGTTQFESTSARQAFPCYDEPAIKANFTIRIIRTEEYSSISNMDLVQTDSLDNNRFMDTFEESVKMSTYLVAFVVSEMKFVEKGNQRVYAAEYLIEDGRGVYGLDVGIETLDVMEDFTQVRYSLNKLYQVAIPDDWFQAGAMENWGLVTYRDRYLLYHENLTTSSEKQNVASIIAHEYGHQWFGNLVSPLWWKYIWLNEGFATYFEYYACSVVEPEMRMMEQFVTVSHQYAFETDALETTRPMSTDAQTPSEIDALFDRIAYDKSGSVIRMMEHFLTTNVYKRALNIYLTNKQYDSAEPSDLWNAIQAAVDENNQDILEGLTVEEIMETWNSQAGYPVVSVQRYNEQILLTQSRFLLYNATHSLDTTWTIPINYVTASNPDFTDTTAAYWLKSSAESVPLIVSNQDWIILNKQETGYYRVNYDENNWQLIIEYLNSDNFTNIHILNRAQLVDDALNLARSGRLNYNITLNLIRYLSKETDYIPLYSFFRGLTFLHKHLLNNEYYDLFKRFVVDLLQGAYDKLGADDTGEHTEKLNRINVLTWLCRYGHESCVEEMHDKLAAQVVINPDLQSIVYCGGLKNNTDIDLKLAYLFERYSGDDAEYLEKNRIISSLGCSVSAIHLNRLLNIAIDQDNEYSIAPDHKTSVFSSVYTSSEVGLETALDFIINNFTLIVSNFDSTNRISTILTGISDRLTTTEQKTKFQTFISSLSEETQMNYTNIFSTSLNNIQTNIDWSEQYVDRITDWLQDYYNSGYVIAISVPLVIATLLSHLFV